MATFWLTVGGMVVALLVWLWWPELSEPFKRQRADRKIKNLTASAIRDMNKHIPPEWRL